MPIAKKEDDQKVVAVVLFKRQKDKLQLIKKKTGQTISHILREIIDQYKDK